MKNVQGFIRDVIRAKLVKAGDVVNLSDEMKSQDSRRKPDIKYFRIKAIQAAKLETMEIETSIHDNDVWVRRIDMPVLPGADQPITDVIMSLRPWPFDRDYSAKIFAIETACNALKESEAA